jgi:hypothetical protein
MSATRIYLAGLVVALFGLQVVHAQQATTPQDLPGVLPLYSPQSREESQLTTQPGAPPGQQGAGAATGYAPTLGQEDPAQTQAAMRSPTSWLVYPRAPGCCGPVGGCGPIGSELFLRSGWTFGVGGGPLGSMMKPGWDIEGGGRVLLFNPAIDKAWTVSLSVSNMFNATGPNTPTVTLNNVKVKTAQAVNGTVTQGTIVVPQQPATLATYNQTFLNFGLGREWYLLGTADPGQMNSWNWRVGCDGGGRWGTAKGTFNEISHLTDTVGGMYAAIHTDVEYPCNCITLQGGIRLEYNYIWDDILQSQNPSDYQSLNLLFQVGLRY